MRTISNFRVQSQCKFGLTGMHHDHPKRCAVPRMSLDRILLDVIFLELQAVRLDATPSWTSVVVADRLESQVYGM